ncbi:sugar phosphate isomerase/epimerase family protein [Puia sp. P3]|uniref:sugar phosphate isomerase/epimerase family protein n=1 Tax=Puia sp. P3 TaxID=3423952 RepID=UPI003D6765A2
MERRNFLRGAGMAAAAAGFGLKGVAGTVAGSAAGPGAGRSSLSVTQLGIAGYTFAKIPLDQGIAMMKRVGANALSIKDFYLPMNSTPETIQSMKEKFTSSGIKIYAAGVIYMKTQAEVDRAFEYAKALGVDLIVGVPNPELLSYTEGKVKQYNIRIAIHNHGPEDKLYPSPVNVYDHIKGLDNRMGLCLDIGHAARAGANPVEVIGKYGNRIFDLHIKDLSEIAVKPKPIELGRGVLDIPGVVKALAKIRYAGYCSIEHEMDMSDPLPGIAESAGYFRGVVKGEAY